jgi:L-asparaginase/Glu-tRNA(Gln) amidotransferase subunit D
MAWTHAFLRYAIKKNHATIVLTGSQIPMPSLGEFSDAYENLENSLRFLTTIDPPIIMTVFNYGKDAFSDSLIKFDKWDNISFNGDVIAHMEWDEIKYLDNTVEIHEPTPLDILYLVTTGGTIESEFNTEGVLIPGQNHVLGYISRRFSSFFQVLSQNPVFAIDSSDLTFDRMMQLSLTVEKCLQETNPDSFVDLSFEKHIKIIYTDPFKDTNDYLQEIGDAKGIVVAGYGGGNINIDERTNFCLLNIIKDMINESRPVVLSSQVPLGTSDFIYSNGYEAIKAGVFSAVDMGIPECQIRLSYIMGHSSLIREKSLELNINELVIIESLFMSGVKFRTKRSRRNYEKLRGIQIHKNDLLLNKTFEESLSLLFS